MDAFIAPTAKIRNRGRDGKETVTGRSQQQHTPAVTAKPKTADKQNHLLHPLIAVIHTVLVRVFAAIFESPFIPSTFCFTLSIISWVLQHR